MTTSAWLIAIAGGLITFLERFAFLAVAERAADVPPRVREALRMIPAAALAALVAPAVLRDGGAVDLVDPRVVAAALAMAAMWRTGRVLVTLLVGMGALVLLQALGWS